ncbi:MAG: AAA family ATPase [Caldilineaceae bacterium]|nr:AAA family ATPase [Caldilineaceae bacterium]MDE0337980.1 AAA family ATPase [Caldilineaceae bacterium]
MESKKKWDDYVRRVEIIVNSGELGPREIDYKLKIGQETAEARSAMLTGVDDWADLLKKALRPNHPIDRRTLPALNLWIEEKADAALTALQAIWREPVDFPVTDRIRSFADALPQSVIRGQRSRGTRTTVASALLMGLDVKQYPPFGIEMFRGAYLLTGYDTPDQGAVEATLYGHALDFLDRLVSESETRGVDFPLPKRLAAQSIVYSIYKGRDKELELAAVETKDVTEDNLRENSEVPLPCDIQELARRLFLDVPDIPFLQEIETLLKEKRQVIFQGPPGTGKTYVAQALAHCLAGSENRVEFVQFHPSYAYEDFVRGFRPTITKSDQAGFTLQDGPLLRAAEKARKDKDSKHFLIIDEINRGNLAKVFGELYFLLEYRDREIGLLYQRENGEKFSLPDNLYIIGTMNTADRSIALVDLALRRRFYFVEFHPDEEPVRSVLRNWLEQKKLEDMVWVADVVDEANKLLENDRHAAIGPSYFMMEDLDEDDVRRIWKHSVLPYIEERLFGDDNRVVEFELDKLKKKAAQTRKKKEDQEQTGGTGEGTESN